MGVLQDREGITEDDVWERVSGGGDSRLMISRKAETLLQEFYADYIFGRMMKFHVAVDKEGVVVPNDTYPPTPDYQAWCLVYPLYKDLIDAAVIDLKGDASERLEDREDAVPSGVIASDLWEGIEQPDGCNSLAALGV